jgi:hypothetical protein
MALTPRQSIELFHLQFSRQLCAGADRAHFTIKGGCNLRFFFASIRYSEDLDLDVAVLSKGTLKNKVDRLLASPALRLPLKASGLEVVDVSAPKQTDTTQRWKLGLKLGGQSMPLRTKVEFSRRERSEASEVAAEAVGAELTRSLGVTPPVLGHYLAPAALTQKIQALVGRPQTQARDVFDLQVLRSKLPKLPALSTALRKELPHAIERAMALSYDDFTAQVVAYLDPAQAAGFKDREVWNALQAEVVSLLEELQK